MNIPLNIDWQQILLHLFNFVILAGGLYFLLYNPVRKFIRQREEHYEQVNKEAEDSRRQAQAIEAEHRVKMEEIDKEIAQKKAEAQIEIDRMREQQLDEARKQAALIIEQAKQSAEQERQDIMDRVSDELKDLVITAAEKIMLKDQKDPYQQFLDLAEREAPDDQKQ